MLLVAERYIVLSPEKLGEKTMAKVSVRVFPLAETELPTPLIMH
jgi:hypothetical protein